MTSTPSRRRLPRMRSCTVLVAVVLVMSLSTGGAVVGSSNTMPAPGVIAALALEEAARLEAWADFWTRVAVAVNDTSTDAVAAAEEAGEELEETLAEVEQQKLARFDAMSVLGDGAYDPAIVPSQFTAAVTHTHFPLVSGRTLVYEAQTPEGLERIEETTAKTVVSIMGVACRPVHAVETLDGVLREESTTWYSQDVAGNVWIFGQIAKHYDEDGFLDSLEGSWRAGKDGAKAGMILPAAPAVGMTFRQQYVPNEEEDYAVIVDVNATVILDRHEYTSCVTTEETSPLEDETNEYKVYAPAVGVVREIDPVTGSTLDLVEIRNH